MGEGMEDNGSGGKEKKGVVPLWHEEKLPEHAPEEVAAFARKILEQYKDDPRCTPANIRRKMSEYASYLSSGYDVIIGSVTHDAEKISKDPLLFCAAAKLYLKEEA